MLKGRQALWMVYDYYRVNAEAGALFDLSDLLHVKLRGDALETFMASWEYVLVGMAVELSEDTLKVLFLDNLRGCPVMREEIIHYDRARVGHPDKSYAYLQDCVCRCLERKRHGENRMAVAGQLAGQPPGG